MCTTNNLIDIFCPKFKKFSRARKETKFSRAVSFLGTPFDRFFPFQPLSPQSSLPLSNSMTSTIADFPPLESKRKFSSTEKEEQEVKEERRKTMFYSQCLLSSKGPLGAIWVAGYFFKRLKKRQITDTDICSSVGLSPFRFFFLILVKPSIFI